MGYRMGVLAVWLGAMLLAPTHALAQREQVRHLLFRDAVELLDQATDEQAAVLAPSNYGRAIKHYRDAESAFERGRGLEGIQKDLEAARSYFGLALGLARQARAVFPRAIAARENARESGALAHAGPLWERAERKLAEAARRLEDGQSDAAVRQSRDASTAYRQAEVEALKVSQLSVAWRLIEKAERSGVKDVAPRTLKSARDLLDLVEIRLKAEAEVTEEIRNLSMQAEEAAKRSLVIASRVRQLTRKKVKLEDIVRESEDRLLRVANLVGADVTYDAPPQVIVEAVIGRVEMQQALRNALVDSLADRDAEIRRLQSGTRNMEVALERQADLRDRVEAVSNLFTDHEALVMQSGRDIVLRLHGINFGVGRAVIEPENFGLLSRVQDAIRTLPHATVTVQGHTDSMGGDAVNLALSSRRAEAVRRFLVANRVLREGDISAVGYGESRPVASNDTPEGRSQNRRIDLVLSTVQEGT